MPSENMVLLGGGAIAAAFLAFFAVDALLADDLEEAAERTTRRFWSILGGAGVVAVAAAAEMLHLLAEVPALVVAALGIGSILAGISWQMFGASALLAFTVSKAIQNARSASRR